MESARRRTPAAQRILDTASALFCERGIRATGVAQSPSRRKSPRPRSTCDERWRASVEAITQRPTDPEARLLAVFEAYGAWLVGDDFRGCGFVNAAAELADLEHPARAVIMEHKAALREHLAGLAADAGSERPEALVEELLLLLDGAAVTASIERTTGALDVARGIATGLLRNESGLGASRR